MAEELAAGPTNAIAETKKLLIDSIRSLLQKNWLRRKKIRIVEIVEMLSKESKLLLKKRTQVRIMAGSGGFEPRIGFDPAGFQATSRAQIPLFCRR